jgi:predicted regulator of Ras-like GTPase activity (Roadblock/LC7/MglB family)
MHAEQALADLTEISSQIEAAALVDGSGKVEASTFADDGAAERFAAAAGELLSAADGLRGERNEALTQLEAETLDGSVFVVREGERVIAATTCAEPTVGLVFYDLKSCLRALEESAKAPAAKKRKPAARKTSGSPAAKPKKNEDGVA